MALKKRFKTAYGGYADYWKITQFSFDAVGKRAEIIITPYLSQAARTAGEQGIVSDMRAIRIEDIDYSGTPHEALTTKDYETYFGSAALNGGESIYAVMYSYIKKSVPYFADATDI